MGAGKIAAVLGTGLLLAVSGAGGAVAQESVSEVLDPWEALAGMRTWLAEASPGSADFTQTFVPAGFPSGDEESGRLAFAMPRCLRWDYSRPYPKSFLICDDLFHSWNPEDRTGVRRRIRSEEEPGLDLLLLDAEALRQRYAATAVATPEGSVQVTLVPLEPLLEIRGAVLTLDGASGRPDALEYRNTAGDTTRYALSDFRPLAAVDLFQPPEGITWQED